MDRIGIGARTDAACDVAVTIDAGATGNIRRYSFL